MIFKAETDIGRKRSVNQDCYTSDKLCENAFVFAVCDGMGGANGGNIASSVACSSYIESVKREFEKFTCEDGRCDITPDEAEVVLIKSVRYANEVVFSEAAKDEELYGMGTTLVSALIVNDTAYVVNVGDSRAYLIFDDFIDRITHDHSYVQYLIDIGQLTEEEAARNVNKNIIMKAIGINDTLEPDLFRVEFGRNAFLLLCSDGLTNFVDEKTIKETVLSFDADTSADRKAELDRICRTLIDKANENGGADNITAALYLHEKDRAAEVREDV